MPLFADRWYLSESLRCRLGVEELRASRLGARMPTKSPYGHAWHFLNHSPEGPDTSLFRTICIYGFWDRFLKKVFGPSGQAVVVEELAVQQLALARRHDYGVALKSPLGKTMKNPGTSGTMEIGT